MAAAVLSIHATECGTQCKTANTEVRYNATYVRRKRVETIVIFYRLKLWPNAQDMGSKKHKKHKRERQEGERHR